MLLLALVCPVLAGDDSLDPDGRCHALVQHLTSATDKLTIQSITASGIDKCSYAKVRYSSGGQGVYSFDQIDIDRLAFAARGDMATPRSMRVSIKAFRILPSDTFPVMQYTTSFSPDPFFLTLDYDFDEATSTLQIRQLDIRAGQSALKASARLARIVPAMTDESLTTVLARAALQSLDLTLNDQDGRLEYFALVPLGVGLLNEAGDPAAEAVALKRQGVAWLREMLPRVNLSPASIESLVEVLTAFPQATQPLHLAINLPRPVGLAELEPVLEGVVPSKIVFPDGAMTVQYGN